MLICQMISTISLRKLITKDHVEIEKIRWQPANCIFKHTNSERSIKLLFKAIKIEINK